jgi:hypothetical protein
MAINDKQFNLRAASALLEAIKECARLEHRDVGAMARELMLEALKRRAGASGSKRLKDAVKQAFEAYEES